MKSSYIIEFYYESEVIDTKEAQFPLNIPSVNEVIAIMTWENPNMNHGRKWWKVIDIKHGIWHNENRSTLTQKTMIAIIPDPKNGLFRNDLNYDSFEYKPKMD